DAAPFSDASFDLVVADHGANRFVDPYDFVPEVARLLRPGGLFVFSGSSPLELLFWDDAADTITTELRRDYFGSYRTEVVDGPVEFDLGYGDWIRLFRANGFTIEDLVEVRPPEGAESSYRDDVATAWARRWPMEQIWKVRKA
ncbi:MAG TPA: methyltransferase domain-containing protein, partial [Gaiellaceae bacterium]|nr:methyltransferase domain-containing protein [Gaiellaceae bacterium]